MTSVARPSHPAPPPVKVDTVRVVLVGAALWAVALVVLIFLGDRVAPVWRWTCVAGIALAGLGLAIMYWQGQIGSRDRGQEQSSGGASDPPRPQRTSNSEVS